MRQTEGDYFESYLSYDRKTGKLYWRSDRPISDKEDGRTYKSWISKYGGKEAGGDLKAKSGTYLSIVISGHHYLAHRIVMMMEHGSIPAGMHVDHINGDRKDNRVENLRFVDDATNKRNMKRNTRNQHGHPGIRQVGRAGHKMWQARAQVNGKEKSLGCFGTKEEAIEARVKFQELDGRYTETHGLR